MGGVRKRPVYKIVVADGRYSRDGKFIEKVGSYNPLLPKDKKERIKVEFERIKYWISKGAQPTLRVSRIQLLFSLFYLLVKEDYKNFYFVSRFISWAS